jgi:polysaccharide biosynthesis protein PslL
MKDRNKTIDVAKGLGIVLVVLGHSWITTHDKGELFRMIFSFHLPLFLFLSGIYLNTSKSFDSFLKSRAKILLKPYFSTLVILGFLRLLNELITNKLDTNYLRYFVDSLYGTGDTLFRFNGDWIPLWFLLNLFVTSVFVLLILKVVENKIYNKAWLIPLSILFLLIGAHEIDFFWKTGSRNLGLIHLNRLPGLPWSIDLLPITSSFMIFGYLLSDQAKSMKFNRIAFMMSISIFFGLHYCFNETIDLNGRIFGVFWISTLQAATGIYGCLSISSLLQRYSLIRDLLAYIGSGTLFVLIFHYFIEVNIFQIFEKYCSNKELDSIASVVVGILMPLAFWEIAKKQKLIANLL